MFTETGKRSRSRGPGRPRGRTAEGEATRAHLYDVATSLIAARGYERTTLRDIAKQAGVSVGLLYRYFPSKQAVLVALYDELSAEYVRRASRMRPGAWRDRFAFALQQSLDVLRPHRAALAALLPVLVGDPDDGLFGRRMPFSRQRVQGVFEEAVARADDAPSDGPALGRLLYIAHLAMILWWLLDKSPRQRATRQWLGVLDGVTQLMGLAMLNPATTAILRTVDDLVRAGLFGESRAER
jgi:AcrR family transcriptional regulator